MALRRGKGCTSRLCRFAPLRGGRAFVVLLFLRRAACAAGASALAHDPHPTLMVWAVVQQPLLSPLMAFVLLTTKQCSPMGMPSFRTNLQLGVFCKAVKWLINPTGFVTTL